MDRAIFGGYLAIKAYLNMGMNIVSDQIFWTENWFQHCLTALHDEHVFFVGMHVSDEEGLRRENQREITDKTIAKK